MDQELADLDAIGSAKLIRDQKVSPKELVEAAIERIETINPKINAVVLQRYEKALVEANDPRLGSTVFAGVPVLLKDVDAESGGEKTFAGSRYLQQASWTDPDDSFVVTQLRQAGLIVVGKCSTPEFALSPHTVSLAHGLTRNPWKLDCSAGGSSGGSGAAVAARLVAVAHGSDAGGSIRIPASLNGVVGLKPSRGRVSNGPNQAEPWGGLSVRGILARTVRDSAALLDVLSVRDETEPYEAFRTPLPYALEAQRELEPLRVGFLDRRVDGSPVHSDVADTVRKTAKRLEEHGCQVEASYPNALGKLGAPQVLVMMSVWTAYLLERYAVRIGHPPRDEELEPLTRFLVEHSKSISAVSYFEVRESMFAISREIKRWWNDFDVLIAPTTSDPAQTHEFFDAIRRENDREQIPRIFGFTPPFNITGQPAISLPLGMSRDGLPIGVQLVSAQGREDVLYRVSAFLEAAWPWSDRKPAVCA